MNWEEYWQRRSDRLPPIDCDYEIDLDASNDATAIIDQSIIDMIEADELMDQLNASF